VLLEVGQITKPHGLRGEVFVKLSTNRDERLTAGTVLQTDRGPLIVETSSPHQNGWIVRFATISTREEAEAARGLVLRAEPLDDPEQLWIHEVIGSDVVDTTGAGDAFVGALAAALDRGVPWRRAFAEALAAGSLACTRAGAQAALPLAKAIAQLADKVEPTIVVAGRD